VSLRSAVSLAGDAIKRAFWRSPYLFRLSVLYARYLLVTRRRALRLISDCGLPVVDRRRLAQVKSSETVFILGSGSSINAISPSRWMTIRRHNSIGFNFWLFHELVPTIYLFELVADDDEETMQQLVNAADTAAARYRGVLKIVSEFHNHTPTLLNRLGQVFRRDLCAYVPVPAFIDDGAQLRTSVSLLRRTGLFGPETAPHNVFKHAGSLSAAVSLAVKMQYKRIILCGIDLASPEYFYQDKTLYPDGDAFHSSIRTAKHESVVPGLYRCSYPADKVLVEVKKQVLDPAGIELFVESDRSALYPEIPLVPDEFWSLLGDNAVARSPGSRDPLPQPEGRKVT
jgi:hypothetical protein